MLINKSMINSDIFMEMDADEFIKLNYEPVEDKPDYVWLNKRNHQMIHIDILKTAIDEWSERIADGL